VRARFEGFDFRPLTEDLLSLGVDVMFVGGGHRYISKIVFPGVFTGVKLMLVGDPGLDVYMSLRSVSVP